MSNKKRGNGLGYVTKMSGKRKNPWYVYAPTEYEIDENGKKKAIRTLLGSFKTKSEAEVFLSNYNLTENAEKVNEDKVTVADVVALYLNRLEIEKKPDNTIQNNKAISKKVNSTLLQKPIKDVTFKEIQANVDELVSHPASQNNFKIFLKHIWGLALVYGYVSSNLVAEVRTAKYIKKKEAKEVFTIIDVWELWKMTKSEEYYTKRNAILTLVQLYTGMRGSELYSIKKKDVNLGERYMIGGVKTALGTNRIIPINIQILHLIRDFYNSSKDEYLIPIDNRTFNGINARVICMSQWLRKNFNVNSHSCRRTFISRAFSQGCNFYLIERIVGHRTDSIGFDAYVSTTPLMLVKEAEKINFIADDGNPEPDIKPYLK